jgi:hypothetical protein
MEFVLDLKTELYSSLSKKENETFADSISVAIDKIQTETEKIHFQHFIEIKKLCKSELITAFESLSLELSKLFSKPQMKRK